MEKILVTTDFSNRSKAGLRFAIQLASQREFDLTFFHSYNIVTPTSWSSNEIESYERKEEKKLQNKLDALVGSVYKGMNVVPEDIKCVIKSSPLSQSNIMEYAAENNFSYICISTRGAGKLERIFGTNTANLINHSDVPVIAVPHQYRASKITSILYASDLINVEKELRKVVAFAKPLNLQVELLHFTTPLKTIIDPAVLEVAVEKLADYDIKLNLKKSDPDKSLINKIESAIKESKPSMLVMFTEQNRTLFQRIFLPGKSAEYSFNSKVPLLVFNKS